MCVCVGVCARVHVCGVQMESMDQMSTCEVLCQTADALIYLHQQNLVHCALTSHAVQLVDHSHARLGNFEYMIDRYCGVMNFIQRMVWLAPRATFALAH